MKFFIKQISYFIILLLLAGFIGCGGGGGLVAAKTNQSTGYVWIEGGSTQTTLNGNTSTAIGTGLANSEAIVAQEGHTNSAAALCLAYDDGTYSDWFLPSRDELDLIYWKLITHTYSHVDSPARLCSREPRVESGTQVHPRYSKAQITISAK